MQRHGETTIKRIDSALLIQIDGSTPNLALMKIAAHLKRNGKPVEFRRASSIKSIECGLWDHPMRTVYASAIFDRSKPIIRRLLEVYPNAVVGGSGWSQQAKLGDIGVSEAESPDYTLYPNYKHSIGFTQRGCRLECSFCAVPKMEGKVRVIATIADIWRGEPWPKNILLLDNDFFGNPNWRDLVAEIRAGSYRVCWNQGFNVRLIGDEHAEAIASVDYRDDQFERRRIYTAWDNRKDEERLFRNLLALKSHGIKPDDIMVYMLIGYWDGPKLTADDFHRQAKLREFGCRPYPMPYVRTHELRGFQRWVVGAYDKRVPWDRWRSADYEPRNLGMKNDAGMFSTA